MFRRCAGVVAAASIQGKRTQHGKPHRVVSDDQPNAREGQIGCLGVAERFAVPLKPGNAGGGKGPQFKTDATNGEGFGDWATYQLRKLFRNCRRRCTRKRRQKPEGASRPGTTSALDQIPQQVRRHHQFGERQATGGNLLDRAADARRFRMSCEPGFGSLLPGLAGRQHIRG